MIKLDRLITSERVFDAPELADQTEVFSWLAGRLSETGLRVNKDTLAREFMKREQLGSTGVGYGIALPHAVTEAVSELVIAVVRLPKPMNWDSVDGQPVRLLVAIVAPSSERDLYLKALAEVARSLNIPATRQRALAAKHAADAADAISSPQRYGFFRRSRRAIVFALSFVTIFIAARFALMAIHLPEDGIYRTLDYAKFSHPTWIFRQEVTITLFLGMVLGTLLFWRFRVAIAAVSLGVLLVAGVMDLETTVEFMSIPTILFIMAMMVIVRWLQNAGVFRFLVVKAVEQVRGIPWLLLLILMGFSVILGGFADEVTAILVTFGLALEVSRRTKAPLVPFLLSLVFATNVGSALTLVGNPIGVYIAFAGRLSFEDFLRWATPVSAVAAVLVALLCLLIYRRQFFGKRYNLDAHELEQASDTIDPAKLRTGVITFFVTVVLIALHHRLEVWLQLGAGTALVAVALMVTGFIVFYEQERGRVLIERGIDWWTLLFFMFLFANAACLEYTGVTAKLGHVLLTVAQRITPGGAPADVTGTTAVMMLWSSGILSGFVDNLPVVAALVPIARDMGPAGVNLPHASILWWALLFGGCFGGNLTVIGSIANHVAVSAYERATGQHIKFGDWIKVGAIVTVVSLAVATVALLIQLRLAP